VSLCVLPAALLAIIPVAGWIGAIILGTWIVSRLSLVFPGIAVDRGITIPLAWELSKNHQVALVVTVIVFPLVLSVPYFLLSLMPWSYVPASIVDTAMTVFTIAALSIAYREIESIEYRA
jgi:hypothetical protein